MNVSNITIVYHPKCEASMNFLIKTKELTDIEIDYINFKEDSFESDIEIDIIPLIILNNDVSQIYKGKRAFDKLEEIKVNKIPTKKNKNSLSYGNKSVTFMPEDGSEKKVKIDLDAKF
tara:strand:+ start:188 stop:541 length:354 start_codon:yes stop_codon:yes gene_type:complete